MVRGGRKDIPSDRAISTCIEEIPSLHLFYTFIEEGPHVQRPNASSERVSDVQEEKHVFLIGTLSSFSSSRRLPSNDKDVCIIHV